MTTGISVHDKCQLREWEHQAREQVPTETDDIATGTVSLTEEDLHRMALIPMMLAAAVVAVALGVIVVAFMLGPQW